MSVVGCQWSVMTKRLGHQVERDLGVDKGIRGTKGDLSLGCAFIKPITHYQSTSIV